jgi:hypothetical protein
MASKPLAELFKDFTKCLKILCILKPWLSGRAKEPGGREEVIPRSLPAIARLATSQPEQPIANEPTVFDGRDKKLLSVKDRWFKGPRGILV